MVRYKTRDIERIKYQEITLTDFTELKEVISKDGNACLVYLSKQGETSTVTIKLVGVHTGIMGTADIDGYKYLGAICYEGRSETWVFHYKIEGVKRINIFGGLD